MLEEEYPYLAERQNTCRINGDTTKIDVAYLINPDEKSIIDWLINFGPVKISKLLFYYTLYNTTKIIIVLLNFLDYSFLNN